MRNVIYSFGRRNLHSFLYGGFTMQDKNGDFFMDWVKKKIDEAGSTLDEATHRNSIIQKKLRSISWRSGCSAGPACLTIG